MSRARLGRDAGVMTTGAALVCTALLLVVLGLAHIGGAVLARHRAQSAADLAALAAAATLRDGGEACPAGREIAVRNGGRIALCTDEANGDVYVEVAVPVWTATAVARARAGPLR